MLLIPCNGDLAPCQQTDEDPGRAHRKLADLLEQEQHNAVDQIYECRRTDIRGIRLCQHNLLDRTAMRVKDNGLHSHHGDDGCNEPSHGQFWYARNRVARQKNIDIGQILYQPLAPEKTG